MNKTKNQLLPIILSILILSFLTAYFILADDWYDAVSYPPFGNIKTLINIASTTQRKLGALTVTELTTSEGVLDLEEGEVVGVNKVIGYNDLFLLSEDESRPIKIYGRQLSFWFGENEKWQISSTGTLAIGFVPWGKLTDLPSDCLEEGQHVIGMNEDGTFKCSFVDYCGIIHRCAKTNEEGKCVPKLAGEYGLPACQRCDGKDLDPVYYDINKYDKEGSNLCNKDTGLCFACDGKGYCNPQPSDQDIGEQCENPYDCFTGDCSGTGYSCGTYNSGQRKCGFCRKCDPDGSGFCVYQTSDEDLGNQCGTTGCNTGFCSGDDSSCGQLNCPDCHKCLIVGGIQTCELCTSQYEECSNCTGTCKGCVNGVCTNIPAGQKDTYGSHQCTATHYRCNGSGSCTRPLYYPCVSNPYYRACVSVCSSHDGCSRCFSTSNCSGSSSPCTWPMMPPLSGRYCRCWDYVYD